MIRWSLVALVTLCGCGTWNTRLANRASEQASTLFKAGRIPEALTAADSALAHTSRDRKSEQFQNARLLKAEILLSAGRTPESLSLIEQPPAPETPRLRARLTMLRGQARALLSDYKQARNLLETALAVANSIGDRTLRAEVEIQLGSLLVRTHDLGLAETVLDDALATAQASGDRWLEIKSAGNLGLLFGTAFRFDDAIFWFERAYRLSNEGGWPASSVRALGNLGWCYERLGDLDKALRNYEEASRRAASLGNPLDEETWVGNSGNLLYYAHDFAGAAARYERALQIATNLNNDYSRSWWLSNLTTLSIERGDWDSAERYLRQVQDLKETAQAAGAKLYTDVNAARIAVGRKDYDRAESMFRAVAEVHSDDPTPRLDAEAGLAQVYAKHGEPSRADRQFEATLAAVERNSDKMVTEEHKLSYRSSLVRFYQDYIDYLIANNRAEEALTVVEASRARLLRQKLALDPNPGSRHSSNFRKLAGSARATLLSYWIGPERSYLWVVTKDELRVLPLPSEAHIRGMVEAHASFVENLRDPLTADNPPAEQLYQLLIAPAEAVGVIGNVIVVPDGCLYGLNFETLVDPRNHSYWIERARLAIAPSLLALTASSGGSKRGAASLLLIGNPDSPGPEYPKLENASREMDLVKQYLGTPDTTDLRGPDARPQAYRTSQPRGYSNIHFAAHATANPDSPLESAVVLSGKPGEYALSAREIISIPLNAQLVTISGCRSAGARVYAGEGLVGLSWAFLQAGARNVIAGLWNVNDQSTANLMGDVYRELARGQEAEDALRAAKLRMIHGDNAYRKPYYWGAFQIYVRRVSPVHA